MIATTFAEKVFPTIVAETGPPKKPAGSKQTIKESLDDLSGAVAKWYLIRENFDLLLGSADAVGILLFLRRRRALERAGLA